MHLSLTEIRHCARNPARTSARHAQSVNAVREPGSDTATRASEAAHGLETVRRALEMLDFVVVHSHAHSEELSERIR